MEKGKSQESTESLTNNLRDLHLNRDCKPNPKSTQNSTPFALKSQLLISNKRKVPPSLLSLCLGIVGSNLEEIIDELPEIALSFPSDIKIVLVAIARRRKLLNDDILIALADSSWDILDLSGSDISDSGLCQVINICRNLRAVDISRCSRLTSDGVSELLQLCHSLEILRWGGCPRSENTARRCLGLLMPNLNDVEGDSWEELDTADLTHGAPSLRWLIWPKIDKDSKESLILQCPRIVVNPKPAPLGRRGAEVPQEALQEFNLDDQILKDIDPETWAVSGFVPRTSLQPVLTPNELSVAEKFRLAFVERDTRLGPKRAKNARQNQRRAEREWAMKDARAKASFLASQATKLWNLKNL